MFCCQRPKNKKRNARFSANKNTHKAKWKLKAFNKYQTLFYQTHFSNMSAGKVKFVVKMRRNVFKIFSHKICKKLQKKCKKHEKRRKKLNNANWFYLRTIISWIRKLLQKLILQYKLAIRQTLRRKVCFRRKWRKITQKYLKVLKLHYLFHLRKMTSFESRT